MIRDPNLDLPRQPKKARPVVHDWRPQPTRREPTPRAADLAVNALGWALDAAGDELGLDLYHEAKRLGLTQLWDSPDDPLSKAFTAYYDKIDRALEALERALR
jgi:hypothetical protein